MRPKILKEIIEKNRVVQFIPLGKERLQDAFGILQKAFYPEEKICFALGCHKDQASCDEINNFVAHNVQDNLSVIAVDKETDKAVAVMICGISKASEGGIYKKFIENHFKEKISIKIFQCLEEIHLAADMFKTLNVTCYSDTIILSVVPEWRRTQIASGLIGCSLEMIKSLPPGSEFTPQYSVGTATSQFVYRISQNYNYEIVKTLNLTDILRKHNIKGLGPNEVVYVVKKKV